MNALKPGIGTLDLRASELATTVRFTADEMLVSLRDGRTIVLPLAWYPRLLAATPQQRDDWRLIGDGYGIHWPQLDEDLSTRGFIYGYPSSQRAASA